MTATLFPHEIDALPNGQLVHTLISEALTEQADNLENAHLEEYQELERDCEHFSNQVDTFKEEIESLLNRYPLDDYQEMDFTIKPQELAEMMAGEIVEILNHLKTIQTW